MAKPMYEGANVSVQDTFMHWMNRTNQIIYDMGTTVLTSCPYPSPNTINGGWTSGNAHLEGYFSSTNLIATSELRGGTASSANNLVVGSNTIFSKAALIHIQPNTASFVVNANNSVFTGSFEMSNTSKTFIVSASTTTIGGGPVSISSNTVFTGANVYIAGANTTISSNTTITANLNVNGNFVSNGAQSALRSGNTYIGANANSLVTITAKIADSIFPISSAVMIGGPSNYFGNIYVSHILANGNASIVGNTSVGNNFTVLGPNATFAGLANTNTLTVRSLATGQVPYSNAGAVVGNSNFTYTSGRLQITNANTSNVSLMVTGQSLFTGDHVVAGNSSVSGKATLGNVAVSSFVQNRIPYVSTANGDLTVSSNLTYNGTQFVINGATTGTQVLNANGSALIGGNFVVRGSISANSNIETAGMLISNSGLVVNGPSTLTTLTVSSFNQPNALLFTGAGGVITSSNTISYETGVFNVKTTNANGDSAVFAGGIIAGGTGSFGGAVDVGGDIEILGNLIVRGTAQLSSNVELSTNSSNISYLTVGPELILSSTSRLVGSLLPRANNTYDLGSNALRYRTIYANNFVGNIDWSSMANTPSPTITFSGDVSGSGTLTSLGNTTITTSIRSANSTVSGVINTAAQTFAGAKTFSTTIVGSINGNANTATRLATSRLINGTGFDGSGDITTPTRIVRSSANTVVPISFVNDTYAATANGALKDLGISSNFTFNPATGTVVSVEFNSSSDERLKENIETISNGLETTLQLRGVRYDRIDTGEHHVGLIAQEVENVLPEVVGKDPDGFRYVSYGNIVGVLVESIKELAAEVKELKSKLEKLEGGE